MSEFKQYSRKGLSEMRPFMPAVDLIRHPKENTPFYRWSDREQYNIARLGAMRI